MVLTACVGRSAAREDVPGLVDGGSAEDGGHDLNRGDVSGRYLERVLVQDDEVGELARLERADLGLAVAGEGGLGGGQRQRVACGQALGRADEATLAAAAHQGIP